MGTKFVDKEEIVSGTRSEDSATLRLSSLRVFTGKMYSLFCLGYLFFSFFKKNAQFEGHDIEIVLSLALLLFCLWRMTLHHLIKTENTGMHRCAMVVIKQLEFNSGCD